MTRGVIFAGFGLGALIGLATAAHAQPAAAPQAEAPSGFICLTNACMKGTASAPPRDAAAVARAIEAGDTAKVMMAGGTPEDVIAGMRSRLSKDPDAILDPARNQVPVSLWMSSIDRSLDAGEVPQFIQNNGRTSLAFFTSSGDLKSVTTIPGMNGQGIPPRGVAFDVPLPPPPPPPPPSPAEMLRAMSGG